MTQLVFTRQAGALLPSSKESRDWFFKLKAGQAVVVEPKVVRNALFFKKFFALIDLAFSYWADSVSPMEYKGQPVLPNKQRFRNDVVILAGFYRSVINLKGEVRLEPESLKWHQMTEERFAKVYDAVITVLLSKVFNGTVCEKWSEEQLREVADQILDFA